MPLFPDQLLSNLTQDPQNQAQDPQNQGLRQWGQLHGSTRGLLLAQMLQSQSDHIILLLTADTREALHLEAELNCYLKDTDISVLNFPDWETLPYDHFSPHPDIVAERLTTLYRLPQTHKGILITPISTLLQRLLPRSYLDAHVFMLQAGEKLNRDMLRQNLERAGYRHATQVMDHGEYAFRGSLVDIFPTASPHPFRLDMLDDEIESIRIFNPSDQLSVEKVEKIELLPAREFPLTETAIQDFRKAFRENFDTRSKQGSLYRDVSNGYAPNGIEYYLPLFYSEMASLFDYLPGDYQCISTATADAAIDDFWEQLEHRYEQQRHDIERPLIAPAELYLTAQQARELIAKTATITLFQEILPDPDTTRHNFTTLPPPVLPLNPRAEHPLSALQEFLSSFEGRVLFVTESAGRREALRETLHKAQIKPIEVPSWQSFIQQNCSTAILVDPIEDGCYLPDSNILVITEKQLLGDRVKQNRQKRIITRDADSVIANLSDLVEGTPVVHIDHGVGRYLGMTTMDLSDIPTELLVLEYAGGDKLYLPVAAMHLINRYTGTNPESAPLHRLGSEQWQKVKRKAAQKAYDVAAELLEVNAKRAAKKGHAFSFDEQAYAQFADAFPFEETPDQEKAILATITDMRTQKPMDRIVCGDVGFGKTEVAMRATFVAVHADRQVAILVPTTLLAQQHYKNFCDRFADWPVHIEVLSRFQTPKQQKQILDQLSNGKVDIVIGTHKLLQNSIAFKQLGLVIIDEEHRFGVRHKEKLKSLRAEVDLLTLTATPIPRTLNMSLAGLRDLSIIATPPAHRHAIKTFVSEWQDGLLLEACQREFSRGGQVYVVHNEVKSIERIARQINEILPHASVKIAHGQMPERELEQVMLDFYHQRFNLLLCTTIIESGIDVPSANTIIINRADKLGLAQLHQLRGRVGRSHHRAYAYLFAPPQALLSSDAEKRLDAIAALEDLGVGFTLATQDMEIRGAGELLGEEQSGQIHEVGFSLYTELLERAVAALKRGDIPDVDGSSQAITEVDLRLPALIPEDYLADVHHRLIMYKRIAKAAQSDNLRELQVEMIDRFGLLPQSVKNLFQITELKLRCQMLGIKKLELHQTGGRVLFEKNPTVDLGNIIKMVQSSPSMYRFDGADCIRLTHDLQQPEKRIEFSLQLVDQLSSIEQNPVNSQSNKKLVAH